MAFGITIDLKQLDELASTIRSGPQRLQRAAVTAMTRAMQRAERRAVFRTTAPGGYTRHVPDRIHRRTARLSGSIGSRVAATGGAIVGALGTFKEAVTPVYFQSQESGHGVILPTGGRKVLTIPLKAALTATGVPRFTARGAAEFYPGGTFWRRSKRGKKRLVLFGVDGSGKLTPLFAGVPSVAATTGIGFIRKSVEEQVEPLRADLTDWFARAFFKDRNRQQQG
jgi:hypothetical protein